MPRERTYYLGQALTIQVDAYGPWEVAKDAAQAVFAAFLLYVSFVLLGA